MTAHQQSRLEFLREELAIWEERRRRSRFCLASYNLYNSAEMDKALGEMTRELRDLESLREDLAKPAACRRRPRQG